MSGFHLLPPSWTSGATATSANQKNAEVGAQNLLFVQPSRRYRSNNLTNVRVTFDTGQPEAWNSMALLFHNGTAAGTFRLYTGDTLGTLFSAPAYQTANYPLRFPGDLSLFQSYHGWLSESQIRTSRYIGLHVDDASNPAGYFEAGVVVVGVKFTPGVGPDLGAKTGRDDPSSMIRLLNGEAIVRAKRGIDTGDWTFPMQTPAETIRWREINRIYGQKIPVAVKWDPIPFPVGGEYQQHTFFYGYPQWRSGGPITYTNGAGLNEIEFGLIEV